MTKFHQHLKQYIIQEKIRHKNKKIPEQLYPAPDIGIHEHHIFHQHKANGKINQEGDQQGGDMWL